MDHEQPRRARRRRRMTPEKFREIRAGLGFTQSELGARLRVNWRTVAKWEHGERSIPGPAGVLMQLLHENPALVSCIEPPQN